MVGKVGDVGEEAGCNLAEAVLALVGNEDALADLDDVGASVLRVSGLDLGRERPELILPAAAQQKVR